jgi:hypothetical protein
VRLSSKLIRNKKILKADCKELEVLNEYQKNIYKAIDNLKDILVGKLVTQERHIVETYSGQIENLKSKFEKEFEEKVKKFPYKRRGDVQKGTETHQ